jgi:hypothetical protein
MEGKGDLFALPEAKPRFVGRPVRRLGYSGSLQHSAVQRLEAKPKITDFKLRILRLYYECTTAVVLNLYETAAQ